MSALTNAAQLQDRFLVVGNVSGATLKLRDSTATNNAESGIVAGGTVDSWEEDY